MIYRIRERPVAGIESADLGWLMPESSYDWDEWPYSRNKAEAETFTDRERAQARATKHRGEVIEEAK